MTYCLNPTCSQPQNPDDARFCQHCGTSLWLGGTYRALELLGQGGFGRTFLAASVSADESPATTLNRCVIKQLLPHTHPATAQKTAELFRQEAAQLAILGQHPKIPRLLAHFDLADAHYLVQEFIPGRNLEQILAAEGPFSEVQIRELLTELLPVLQFIHQQQVIHRDLKPANIIRTEPAGTLALVDFGAAKLATESVLQQTGTMIGSAGYVAPEQTMGKAEFASDLYSLGVTCIHLLTGLHPFDLYSVSEDRWVWRHYLPRPITLELRRVLDKLLERATSQRYQTAAAVLQDLRLEPAVALSQGAVTDRRSGQGFAVATGQRPPVPARPRSLRSIPDWQFVRTLTGHRSGVTAVAISPDGHFLASGSRDRTICLWDLATGDLLETLDNWRNGHQDTITTLTFSSDGYILVSSSEDGLIKQWDLTGDLLSTLPGHGWGISALALSLDGTQLISGDQDGVIQCWNPETEVLLATFTAHREPISGLQLAPDGQLLISSSYDKQIRLWDLPRRRLITTLKGHLDRVSAITVSPRWQTLISGSHDKTVKLWNLNTTEQVKVIAAHKDAITSLAIHPKRLWFASGSEDGTIKVWDLRTGERLATLHHAWAVHALTFSPDGQFLVSGSADETVKIWRSHSGSR
ncbi:MAG: protein kinase [Synechococcales cyanobacterium C42_A2020_086]|jgi:WD40 repeat protein|nr:protein kinase [Synechococcales cyanobacterium C42_A2020_086]